MRHPRAHSHPCCHAELGCVHRVPCDGEEVPNVDGAPTVLCLAYHLDGGRIADVPCEACADARCSSCGAITRLEPHARDCKGGEALDSTEARA